MGRVSPRSPDALLRSLAGWSDRFDLGEAITAAMRIIRAEDLGAVVRFRDRSRRSRTIIRRSDRSRSRTTSRSNSIAFDLPERLPAAAAPAATAGTTTIAPEAPCLLVLGENSTGKSSILEAVALTCLPPQAGRRLKLDASRLTLNPEYMGSADPVSEPESRVEIVFHDGRTRSL